MERPYSIEYPEPSGPPQLTTFYSFKGGVGRTQSLYNVGVRLAALRRKVLMVDVDLEAPGLSIGALEDQDRNSKDGFAEIASDLLLELEVTIEKGGSDLFAEMIADYQERLDLALHFVDVPMPPRQEGLAERLREEMGVTNLPTGSLALLSSGRIDPDYPRKMINVEISEAFERGLSEKEQDRLPEFLDAAGLDLPGIPDNLGLVFTAVLRFLLRNATDPKTEDRFQHVLIDSRSGLADVGGLCLRGLPDTRVVLSGLNEQNLEGTRMVLNTLSRTERSPSELITVFSPVPEGEANLVDKRIETAKKSLTFRDEEGEDQISEDQIQLLHYHPRIALEEKPFTESFHRRTRIYDEYETLTDDLLSLTGSDVRSLVSDALDRFRGEEEILGEDENIESTFQNQQLAAALIPAAFLDEEHVESVIDGLCSQMQRSGPYEPEATSLFDLWVTLSSNEVRILGTTANYYFEVGNQVASEHGVERGETFFQRCFALNERIVEAHPKEHRAWSNWGLAFNALAHLHRENDPDRAENLYLEAFDRFERAVDIKPDYHQALYNWGNALGGLAHLHRENDPDQAEDLYLEAFDRFERAVDIKPDYYQAWVNWGNNLSRLTHNVGNGNLDRVISLYQEVFEKYREAVNIKPDKHEAWFNWGTDLGRFAQLVKEDDSERAESLYQEAFDKFQEAVSIHPHDHEVWGNWGIFLTRRSRMLHSDDKKEVQEVLSAAVEKLNKALSHDENDINLFWSVVALAERNQGDDIEEASDRLQTLLEENPNYAIAFDGEDADAVRSHPELFEILNEYRENIDEEELDESDSPGEVDALEPGE